MTLHIMNQKTFWKDIKEDEGIIQKAYVTETLKGYNQDIGPTPCCVHIGTIHPASTKAFIIVQYHGPYGMMIQITMHGHCHYHEFIIDTPMT